MNTLIKTQLQKHFSDAQMRAFFGARSDDELGQIVTAVETMTTQQLAGFKRQLGAVHRQRMAHRKIKSKGHSVFGSMLVDVSKHMKESNDRN